MNYLDSVLPETVTNRPYNEKLIGHSKSIKLGYRRGRRALLVFYLLALAVFGFWIGGWWGV
jgi:hypothetical protein